MSYEKEIYALYKYQFPAVTASSKIIEKFKYSKVKWRFNAVLFKSHLVNSIPACGRQEIICLDDDYGIVHYSFLMPSCCKFSFMKNGDCMIGPCWTREDKRGKGIYPEMLRLLASNYIKNNTGANVYILARPSNVPSTKGILKAGFVRIGYCYKTRFLKKYYLYKILITVSYYNLQINIYDI